jgi:carboxylate-amine ligase
MTDPFRIGVEEEFFVGNAETKNPLRRMPKALLDRAAEVTDGRATTELLQCQIEVSTPACETIAEAHAHLARYRQALSLVASEFGLEIVAAGTHPLAQWTEQEYTDKPRYHRIADDLQFLAQRNLVCALHVHVEVSDPAIRIDIMNRMLGFLPVLMALSTSSPFWRKHLTGLCGYRLTAYDELPRTGIPDQFTNLADYLSFVDTLVASGIIEDASHVWWAIRPSAHFPTLEMRVADSCTDLRDAVCIAALYRCLVRTLRRRPEINARWHGHTHLLIEENRWRAQRYGIAGGLIDFEQRKLVPFADMLDRLLDLVHDDAVHFGCVAEVEFARTIVARGTSAQHQVQVFRKLRDDGARRIEALRSVVDWLARTTRESARGEVDSRQSTVDSLERKPGNDIRGVP